MAKGIGIASRGNAHRLTQRLVKSGYVTVVANTFRSVELIDAERAALWKP